ncbi:MAG: T9SS type A sorting domain-containing protein [Bacteroidetes bacterium]|nr:T9SS type A sorting domain-containing protein [Bacteroidota bacterium]MBU1579465.1 T9SS type A sorting domain-containing protein [Bacteroidota bacterium]MBU2466221.1 T9SS type A sorting domain-containing protein [Bacteroidota bacterium]MBU2557969.1 T9SS type A sorting domain-containing protein [Bacteroidota bacterium]
MKKKIYALLFFMLPLMLFAQWSSNPADNLRLTDLPGEDVIPKTAICPNGDVYVAYFALTAGNYNVRLQRLDHQGNLLWDANGILISDHPTMTWLTDWDMTADHENHAILTWQDIRNGGNNNIVAYRISPEGEFVWGADGLSLSNSAAFDVSPKVTVTDQNNVIVAWQSENVIIRQKISPDGSLQWGDNGITMSGINNYTWPQLMPVGEDDFVMKYFEDSGPPNAPTRHVFAQRFTSDGSAVWTSPAVISNAGGISAWTQIFPIINDGNDGFYIAWHDDRDFNNMSSSFVQHVDADGTITLGDNGTEVSGNAGMHHFYPQLAKPADDLHIYVLWNEVNGDQNQWGIFGQKVSEAGDLKWGANGKSIIPVTSHAVLPQKGLQHDEDILLVYEDYFNGVETALKAFRIDNQGDFVWDDESVFICNVQSSKVHLDISDWHQNQWVMSWEDDRSGGVDIYAQNLLPSGELGPTAADGTLSGTITLINGTADLSLTAIYAGDFNAFADADGNYSIALPAGTYEVTATNPYAETAIESGVEIIENETTTLDFELNVNRTDMIIRAVDQYGQPLFDWGTVEVNFTGPEGTYNDIFTEEVLVFEQMLYGYYTGTATIDIAEPVEAEATIDADNNELVFEFIIGGLDEQSNQIKLSIAPNPITNQSRINIFSDRNESVSLSFTDLKGQQIGQTQNVDLQQGNNQILIYDYIPLDQLNKGIYLLQVKGQSIAEQLKMLINN